MRNRRKQIAMLLACTTAVGTCSLSCENKKKEQIPPDKKIVQDTIVSWDEGMETTPPTTTTQVTTQDSFEVTTAVSTEKRSTTTTTTTAYIAKADVTTTYVDVVQVEAVATTSPIEVAQITNPVTEIEDVIQPIEYVMDVAPTAMNTVKQSYASGFDAQTYYIEFGDCLSTIAEKFDCSEEAIRNTNASIDDWNLIMPGDCIIIPGANLVDTYYSSNYIVESGDCLSIIAEKLECYPDDVVYANPCVDWDCIQPGDSIVIPNSFAEVNNISDSNAFDNNDYVSEWKEIEETNTEVPTTEVQVMTEVEVTPIVETTPVETVQIETTVVETTSEENVSIETTQVETPDENKSSETTAEVSSSESETTTSTTEEVSVTTTYSVEAQIPFTGSTDENDSTKQEKIINDMPKRRKYGYHSGKTTSNDYNSLLNMEHSCADINGYIVPSKSTFSWLEDIGPCEDGYEIAYVIDDSYIPTEDGPLLKDKGGGICVTATCLRIAVEDVVGPENIIEAHDHLMNGVPIDMSYAKIGHQASINYPDMDFKFYNPFDYSLEIEAYFSWVTNSSYVFVSPKYD